MASSLNTVIVDDQDSRISYSGQWSLAGGSTDYSRTSYAPRSEGAQMSFTFSGTSITVVGNIDAGAMCNATFAIDGNTSSYTSPLVNATQHHQTIWSSPELAEGQHTLVYTSSSCTPAPNSTSTSTEYKSSIWLDYLLYDTVKIPDAATIFIDDRDQRLRYSGDWIKDGGDGDFRMTRQGGKKGSSVQLSFTGTSVTVVGRLDTSSPIVRTGFTVDGGNQQIYGAGSQSTTLYNVEFFRNGSLPQGPHTLVIDCLDEGPFWLDYVLLRSLPPTAPHKGGVPIGAIVGIVIGVACLAIGGFLAWFFCLRRGKPGAKKLTLTRLPKRGFTVRRITRYDEDAVDPFSRDPVPEPVTPPRPTVPHTPSLASHRSTSGLLPASSSYDTRSMSEASLRHPASVHTDVQAYSHCEDFDDCPDNLPPEYATTAPSGTNIGYIPPVPGIPSIYSGTSSAQYPPSRSNTYSTMHHRHNSGPSDVAESEISYPPTPTTTSQSSSPLKPRGYGTSRLSSIPNTSQHTVKSQQRFVATNPSDDEHLSVAEMKRRQKEASHVDPIQHTDSGVRLPKPGESAHPPRPTSHVFSAIHERHMSLFSNDSWAGDQHVAESSVGHGMHLDTRSEPYEPLLPPPVTPRKEPTAGPSSISGDGQSIAELKRRQEMLILSPDGMSSYPAAHASSSVRSPPRHLPDPPIQRNVPARPATPEARSPTVGSPRPPIPASRTDSADLTELPPMYSLN
ncbi:hypothetical protein PM082_019353 [Marasmius tenuissimus]|nr:hypothetical protein PM082_019353 [Marasmius tenuissimus]